MFRDSCLRAKGHPEKQQGHIILVIYDSVFVHREQEKREYDCSTTLSGVMASKMTSPSLLTTKHMDVRLPTRWYIQ